MLLAEIERQQQNGKEVALRGDAAFAKPGVYQALEELGVKYAIRFPANENLEREIEELLAHPTGRPNQKPVVRCKSPLPGGQLVDGGPLASGIGETRADFIDEGGSGRKKCLRTGSEKRQLRVLRFSGEVKLARSVVRGSTRTENSPGPSIQRRSGAYYRPAGKSKLKFRLEVS